MNAADHSSNTLILCLRELGRSAGRRQRRPGHVGAVPYAPDYTPPPTPADWESWATPPPDATGPSASRVYDVAQSQVDDATAAAAIAENGESWWQYGSDAFSAAYDRITAAPANAFRDVTAFEREQLTAAFNGLLWAQRAAEAQGLAEMAQILDTLAQRVSAGYAQLAVGARSAFETFWGLSPSTALGLGAGVALLAGVVALGVLVSPGGAALAVGGGSGLASAGTGLGRLLGSLGYAVVRVVK